MRMHSYGKFSPNLIIGALLVFSLIVLYNYWSISALNHDLTLKIHSLEQQIISLSKTNEALQNNLEKVEQIREKVEVNLQKEQISEQQAKEEVSQKDSTIKSLRNDLENARQEAVNCKDENNAATSKLEKREQEISNFKEKITSLQAQIVEKDNKIGRIEKELEETKKLLAKASSTAKSTSAKPNGNGPVDKPGTMDEQPVLLIDPAAPYPAGWMNAGYVKQRKKPQVKISVDSDTGIQHHGSPVLIFDPPNMPRAKARFSVVDPPKTS